MKLNYQYKAKSNFFFFFLMLKWLLMFFQFRRPYKRRIEGTLDINNQVFKRRNENVGIFFIGNFFLK